MGRDGSLLVGGFSQALLAIKSKRGSGNPEQDDNETDLQSAVARLFPASQNESLADAGLPHLQTWIRQHESGALPSADADGTPIGGAGVLGPAAAANGGILSPPADHPSDVGQASDNGMRLDATAHCLGSSSPATASLRPHSIAVTTDSTDYAPGSTATFSVSGIRVGSSVAFRIADLPSSPGVNGIADVYTPFRVTDGGPGDMDGVANGKVVANWQVPADGRATGAQLQLTATSNGQSATATFSDAANKIVTENQKTGTSQSVWAIHGSIANEGDSQIQGFTTQISTNAGQTVSFKINTASSGYTLDIYRLGYYGGNGATFVTSMHHAGADNQPNPIFNSATNTVDAGNWSVTDSWAIPSGATSGVYFAKLTTDSGNFQNMIPFVVRNDGTASDLLFQTSDQTWEAYNPWGGYNLYQGPSGTNSDRASAVSYNRPIDMNSNSNLAQPADFVFGEEYAAIYWLEQNGYDLNYISGVDASTNPGLLLNAKTYLDVGHDEYWAQSQFANVKAAAHAGVNLAFLSGNQIFWDTQLAPSFDASQTPNRTIVEYKDIWGGRQDPNGTANGGAGTFRDPTYGPGTPENSLSGTIFTVDESGTLSNITIPASMSQLRFWRNTGVASGNGGTLNNLLGYEWDSDLDNGFRPGGLIDMSSTTLQVNTLLLDNGAQTGPGTATHSLTLYRDPTSGALVFGAGTVMWSWGLSNQYVPYHGITAPVSTAVQQSMVNLFADMGVTPQTLQASLVLAQASTDHTPPTAVITSPAGGTSISQGTTVTITGTASDVGGQVAGIEVSTDNGSTWHPATGTTNWSYSWIASGSGNQVIEARASDDSVNLQSTPATVTVNVTGSSGGSLFTASNIPAQTNLNDGSPLEVGVKFTSSSAGQITALKFYRNAADTGSDLLDLWSSSGTKLASATFTNTSASGWQTVSLATPVSIAANTTYIASYHTSGAYVATTDFFNNAFTSGALTAPSSAASGGNGVYTYGGTSTAGIFPTSTFSAANYYADVVFSTSTTDTAPVLAIQTGNQNATVGSAFSLTLPAGTFTDSDGDPLTYSAMNANGTALPSWLTFNASTRTFSGTPTSADVGTLNVKASAADPAGLSASETFNIAVSTTSSTASLFTASSTPAQTNLNDGSPLEVGVKFTSSSAGQITALKFYRNAADTGSDLLDLWSSSGTKLASATFTNTSASGWQTVSLATPVSIAANTTYIASYHTSGAYVATNNFFTNALTSGPLTAPSDASSGGNGVYTYGGTSTAGIFPTSSFNASNYYADVVFSSSASGGDTPPVLAIQTSDQNATVGSPFSLTLPAGTFTDSDGDALTYSAIGANGAALPAWLTFNASTRTFSGTPTSADVGTVGVKTSATDPGGHSASETFNVAVTTTSNTTASLFSASNTPANNYNDGSPVEVGVKFTSSQPGQITALKFYRNAGDTGPDLVDLWSSTGTNLASASFTNTSASGWQTVTLPTPVSIAANTTYVASYHTSGAYVATGNFFTSALASGPLTAPSNASSGGNGVYAYGGSNTAGLFPNSSFNSTNYYADVVFRPQLTG